jgi:hypothetical protein
LSWNDNPPDTVISLFPPVEGVHKVLVALMAQKAEVSYDPSYIFPSQIANHIIDLGFGASVLEDVDGSGEGMVELKVGLGMRVLRGWSGSL